MFSARGLGYRPADACANVHTEVMEITSAVWVAPLGEGRGGGGQFFVFVFVFIFVPFFVEIVDGEQIVV